jgi:hypothetical protein
MRKKIFGLTLSTMLFALCFPAEAQQTKKVPRIGYLMSSCSGSVPTREAFRQGLRELGYVEGQNIAIECRSVEGKFDRVPDLVAELVGLKVDVIECFGACIDHAVSYSLILRPPRHQAPLHALGFGCAVRAYNDRHLL